MNSENDRNDNAKDAGLDSDASMNKVRQLINELNVARLSEPSDDALAKYARLSEQIEARPKPSVWQKIKATLSWDSREQLVAQGARGGSAGNYRMVYAAEQTEIEIMIESQAQSNFIEGDIVPLEQNAEASQAQTPALIMLFAANVSSSVPHAVESFEVESDEHGRFRFENIGSGVYDMQLLLLNGSLIEINDITLL